MSKFYSNRGSHTLQEAEATEYRIQAASFALDNALSALESKERMISGVRAESEIMARIQLIPELCAVRERPQMAFVSRPRHRILLQGEEARATRST